MSRIKLSLYYDGQFWIVFFERIFKAELTLKSSMEQLKTERKVTLKERKQQEKDLKFLLKQEKKKEKNMVINLL